MLQLNDTFQKEFVVSLSVYQNFLETFNDRNPLHTNDSFARSYGFQGKVMHGNILNGFLSYFVGECLPLKNFVIHWQRTEFKAPVYLDDSLLLECTLIEAHASVKAFQFKFAFRNLNSEKVVAKGRFQIGLL